MSGARAPADGGGALDAVLSAGGEPLRRLLAAVEQRMHRAVCGHGAALARHADGTISAGGKRLRPMLSFLCAGVPPPQSERLERCGAAVELVHAATLVHDDVLDSTDLRRGRPTVIASGGRLAATATGDLLFSRAFAELAGTGSAQAVRVLSRASAELARGELMQQADAWQVGVGVERYLERCRLKTAVLFRAACELGVLAVGGGWERAEQLGRFGERIGVAFQILDDILDMSGPPERTGKPRGTDLLDGTVTLPLIRARALDAELRGLELRQVRGAAHAALVCDQIAATGALGEARKQAMGLVGQALSELPRLPSAQRAALELVAQGVVDRYA